VKAQSNEGSIYFGFGYRTAPVVSYAEGKCQLFNILLLKCSEYTILITINQGIPEIHKACRVSIKEF
jgi:hypothetical protein